MQCETMPLINPRTAGGLSHIRTAGGRIPPPQTRKLRKIATSGKRRPKGRGKIYKNTVDLCNFVPLFNFSLCSMSSISPKR